MTTRRRRHTSGMDAAEGEPHLQARLEREDIPDESTVPPHALGSVMYRPIDKAIYDPPAMYRPIDKAIYDPPAMYRPIDKDIYDPRAYIAIEEVVEYEENTKDVDDEEVMKKPEQAVKKKPAAFETAAHMKKPEQAIKKRPAAFDMTAHNTEPLKKKPAAAEKVVVAKPDSTSAGKAAFVKAVLRDQVKSRKFRSSIDTLEPIIKTLWNEDASRVTG